LHVCHLAYTFYETDNRVIRYAESLAARGDAVDVIALRRESAPEYIEINGVCVHRIQRRNVNERKAWAYFLKVVWFALRSALFLSLRHFRRPYDVVHVHNIPDFLVFAALLPRLLGARIVLDIHDVVPELYAGKFGVESGSVVPKLLLRIERASCRFADHVIVANHLWLGKLSRRAVADDKCTALMNYPDTSVFKVVAPTSNREVTGFVMLYHGTLNRHQGLDIAVAAFSRVADALAGAEFHIYGEGPARERLIEQVRQLGLADRVKITGLLPLTEIARVVASASVGIVPKRADGFGNEAFSTKTLEFMACRVPVIVSRTKVDAYYFHDGMVRFFTPGSVDDLAAQMRWSFEEPAQLDHIARAGHAYALEHRWEAHADSYLAIVDRLDASRRCRRLPPESRPL
jgi:glycosyltransferase involved in cell wall biosynthesis